MRTSFEEKKTHGNEAASRTKVKGSLLLNTIKIGQASHMLRFENRLCEVFKTADSIYMVTRMILSSLLS